MSPYVGEFRLSVTAALRDQLIASLGLLDHTPLTVAALAAVQRRGGVYQLYEDDNLVYVGKSTRNLFGRLTQHYVKLSGRAGGLINRISFKCVYVDEDLDAVAPETLLIAEYREAGGVVWNTNGFGNKDPGKRRDTSEVKAAHFDALYPIDLDLPITITLPNAPVSADDMLWAVKTALPYNFRFEQGPRTKAALRRLQVPVGPPPFLLTRTAREWFEWLSGVLPESWSIVVLPGYVIGYPDRAPGLIPSRTGSWSRDTAGSVVFTPHQAELVGGEVEEDETDEDE